LVTVGYDVKWSTRKTAKSRRVIAIDPLTVEGCAAIAAGNPKNVSNAFDRLVRDSGLPRIRLHDTRRTAATVLLDQGVPLKVVSERLGHSSVSITADLYQHVLEHMQDDAARLAGIAILGSR